MERAINTNQMQDLDKRAIFDFGIPRLILMENAGREVADFAFQILRKNLDARVSIFCGTGFNGGDGLVCARHLLNKGVRVAVFLIGEKKKIKEETKIHSLILENMKTKIKYINSQDGLLKYKDEILGSDLLIDAIFGVGLKGKVGQPYFGSIDFINKTRLPTLAVDIPSGLDADSGVPLGVAIRAKWTVSFVYPKKGLLINDGPSLSGRIIIRDIGISRHFLTSKF